MTATAGESELLVRAAPTGREAARARFPARLAPAAWPATSQSRGQVQELLKLGSVLEEAGVARASYPTVNRRLRVYAQDAWRGRLSATCVAHAGLGPASLVLYDVSTLAFDRCR